MARAHAGAGRLRAGDGAQLAGAGLRRHHGDARSASSRPRSSGCRRTELAAAGLLPTWLGDEELHRSHRSNLIAKDPGFYRQRFAERFGGEPDDLPYVWPAPDDVPPAPGPDGVRVWVVRPRNHNELGACLAAGVVGLGTQSGIDVDATGLAAAELRALSKELSGRRPAKDLRQLSAFLDEVAPGDRVALPIEHGAGLLLGEVVGDYLFQGRELLPHRRPARWERVVAAVGGAPARHACRTRGRCSEVTLDAGGAGLGARQRHVLQPHLARGRPASRRRRGSGAPARAGGCGPAGSARRPRRGRPEVIGRRKSVVLLTPTANWPRSTTAVLAPMLAADSTTEQ